MDNYDDNRPNPLNAALEDIAESVIPLKWRTPAPNTWQEIKDDRSQYGECFDYETYDQGKQTIIYPICAAAIEWCAQHLPQWLDRWGRYGYVLDTKEALEVVKGMKRDGLLSESEYVDRMLNEQELQHAQAHSASEEMS